MTMRVWVSGLLVVAGGLGGCSPERNETPAAVNAPAQQAEPKETPVAAAPASDGQGVQVQEKIVRSEEEWKKILTPEQYRILREKGTERAFTGKYWNTKTPGVYACAGCGEVLFDSSSKFDSGCGWPSFDKAMADGKITEHVDTSYGMVRTEVVCAKCGGHLGHLFDDGPTDTGMRYCINSASIDLKEKKDGSVKDAQEPKK